MTAIALFGFTCGALPMPGIRRPGICSVITTRGFSTLLRTDIRRCHPGLLQIQIARHRQQKRYKIIDRSKNQHGRNEFIVGNAIRQQLKKNDLDNPNASGHMAPDSCYSADHQHRKDNQWPGIARDKPYQNHGDAAPTRQRQRILHQHQARRRKRQNQTSEFNFSAAGRNAHPDVSGGEPQAGYTRGQERGAARAPAIRQCRRREAKYNSGQQYVPQPVRYDRLADNFANTAEAEAISGVKPVSESETSGQGAQVQREKIARKRNQHCSGHGQVVANQPPPDEVETCAGEEARQREQRSNRYSRQPVGPHRNGDLLPVQLPELANRKVADIAEKTENKQPLQPHKNALFALGGHAL